MKNFPHQFSDLERLTNALRVASTILDRGADFTSDGVYGTALARAGVYTFRGGGNLQTLLRRERDKPRSQRGTETAAREMRRFLVLAGFIEIDAEANHCALTPSGKDLVRANSNSVIKGMWRSAMLNLALEDAAGRLSHPYRILLRLITDNPGIETRKLMLSFEAQTDSGDEYTRISEYIDLDYDDMLDQLGVSEASAKNAVKILPSIAEQVGDIRRADRRSWTVSRIEAVEDGFESISNREIGKKTVPGRGRTVTRNVDVENIAATPVFNDAIERNYDLSGGIELRKLRTASHQELVRAIARVLSDRGFTLSENPFDCLAQSDEIALLIEVKTLDGGPSDERRQAEKALGQLKAYSHFDLPEDVDQVREMAVFSHCPSEQTRAFLRNNGITVVWSTEDDFVLADNGDLVAFDPDRM